MAGLFKKAEKKFSFMRVGLRGPTNSGKTATMMRMLVQIAKETGKPFAVLDSESGRASKYIGWPNPDGGVIEPFDVVELDGDYSPARYVEVIQEAERGGYCALGMDSISHEWIQGVIGMVDASEGDKGGKFGAGWKKATPEHDRFVLAMMRSRLHIIATMRDEMAYERQVDASGKVDIVCLGLQPVQRTGKTDITYEFDLVLALDKNHVGRIVKAPPSPTLQKYEKSCPGADIASLILGWLNTDAVPLEEQLRREREIKERAMEAERAEAERQREAEEQELKAQMEAEEAAARRAAEERAMQIADLIHQIEAGRDRLAVIKPDRAKFEKDIADLLEKFKDNPAGLQAVLKKLNQQIQEANV